MEKQIAKQRMQYHPNIKISRTSPSQHLLCKQKTFQNPKKYVTVHRVAQGASMHVAFSGSNSVKVLRSRSGEFKNCRGKFRDRGT